MDSFFLAEMFKYLYLIFAENDDLTIDPEKYVFTTEAHLLPLSLSTFSNHTERSGFIHRSTVSKHGQTPQLKHFWNHKMFYKSISKG